MKTWLSKKGITSEVLVIILLIVGLAAVIVLWMLWGEMGKEMAHRVGLEPTKSFLYWLTRAGFGIAADLEASAVAAWLPVHAWEMMAQAKGFEPLLSCENRLSWLFEESQGRRRKPLGYACYGSFLTDWNAHGKIFNILLQQGKKSYKSPFSLVEYLGRV